MAGKQRWCWKKNLLAQHCPLPHSLLVAGVSSEGADKRPWHHVSAQNKQGRRLGSHTCKCKQALHTHMWAKYYREKPEGTVFMSLFLTKLIKKKKSLPFKQTWEKRSVICPPGQSEGAVGEYTVGICRPDSLVAIILSFFQSRLTNTHKYLAFVLSVKQLDESAHHLGIVGLQFM